MAITKGSRVNAARLPENRKERSADGRSALFCMLAFGKREMVNGIILMRRIGRSQVVGYRIMGSGITLMKMG